MQNRWRKLDLMQSSEMAQTKLRIDAMRNGADQISTYLNSGFNSWMSLYNTGASKYFPLVQSSTNPSGFDYSSVETDWQDEVFKSNAFMHNYNLSMDGANENGDYAVCSS